MSPPLRLFIVRHGQVASNRELRYIGRRDEPLTELGATQAQRLGEAFAELDLSRVVSSPLLRARSTAAAIAAACDLEVETDDRLIEQSYGDWEGRSRKELKGEEGGASWLRRFDADACVAPPEGESLQAVQDRVVGLVEELYAGPREGSMVLVSHVGPIKALLSKALDITLLQSRRFFLDPATVTVIDWGEPPLLRLFNSHSHLGWPRALWMTGDVARTTVASPARRDVRAG